MEKEGLLCERICKIYLDRKTDNQLDSIGEMLYVPVRSLGVCTVV